MLESLINPKRAEKGPWKMFFIGILYASLSLLLVHFLFSEDSVLAKFSGLMVVLFCVMFSIPFIYYSIKNEEIEDEEVEGIRGVWKVHGDAIFAFMWLFLGFIVAFAFWYIILQDSNLLNAQIETYCNINSPGSVSDCISEYSFTSNTISTSALSNGSRFLSIIGNNFGVMIFTLIFSLIFGAGAIFILAWNASVISAAIGIFSRYNLSEIPLGLLRYMIHGFPEIAAYFITALAGGIFGVGAIRHGIANKKFVHIVLNVIILITSALIILVVAALIEVYITPLLFR
ncbi:MAG: stage II sporulation protein M [Candidatus Nanoarchaeia archaeon]|nr:stage II sporulation protein M [Candidatus Nanoarchaeia archaeon]MDD5358173.1 stage II sporulation protein M [Candidatus Nanoarchaeia archaeon]MDD5589439.1 stage II sporulation protein M [Candidatus Nanoarchaeia archaeon]